MENFNKIDKRAGGNKAVQAGNFQKIDNLCSRFIRYSRVPMYLTSTYLIISLLMALEIVYFTHKCVYIDKRINFEDHLLKL